MRYIITVILLLFLFTECEKSNLETNTETTFEIAKKGNNNGAGKQKPDKFDLELLNITVPDTVNIGATMIITGQIKNKGNAAYNGSPMELGFLISTNLAVQTTITNSDFEESLVPLITVILPKKVKTFELEILITETHFQRGTKNAIVFWPMGINPTEDDNILDNYAQREVHVRD